MFLAYHCLYIAILRYYLVYSKFENLHGIAKLSYQTELNNLESRKRLSIVYSFLFTNT